jgi:2-dehydro-3-deoxygluconokinase
MTEVPCLGEALASLTPVGDVLEARDQLHLAQAGAEVNVAIHLARLGLRARYAGRVGAHPFGACIRATLARAGVDTAFLEDDPRRTGLHIKDARVGGTAMLYYRSGSAGSAHDAIAPAAVDGVSHVHVTGVTPAPSAGRRAIVDELVERHPQVSVDAKYRPALWSPEEAGPVLLDIARRAVTVFVGLDEAESVWGCAPADEVRRLMPEPARLVVKNDPRPVVVFAGQSVVVETVPPVEVVEPGAGDACAAGHLAAAARARDPRTAPRSGNAVAASVVRDLGDHGTTPGPGIGDLPELVDAPRRRHSELHPRVGHCRREPDVRRHGPRKYEPPALTIPSTTCRPTGRRFN